MSVAGAKPLTGTVDTKHEADELRASLLQQLAETPRQPAGSLTVAQYAEAYFDRRKADGFRAADDERKVFRVRIAPHWIADLPIATVTRKHVLAWLDATKKTPVYRVYRNGRRVNTKKMPELSSLRRFRSVIYTVFFDAVERDVIPSNPAARITIKSPKSAPRWTYLTRDEVERVVNHELIPARHRWLYTVAIFTGLRRGELWALRWGDVHLEGPNPHVYVRGSHDTTTKTGRERIVPLLPRAHEALRKLHAVARDTDPGVLVFCTRNGARRNKADRAGWGRNGPHLGYRVVAGLTRRVPFHAFRHTCASALLQGYWGTPWALTDVRDFLGHSSLKVTERYAHLSVEHLHARARDIRAFVTTVGNDTFPAAADQIRSSSISSGGFDVSRRETGRFALHDIAMTYAMSEARGVAADVMRAALLHACVGTEWEPAAKACVGRAETTRALELADAILRSASDVVSRDGAGGRV